VFKRKKIYITQIVSWINFYNYIKIKMIKPINSFNHNNFTLNNRKPMYKIKIKNILCEIKNECLRMGKEIFTKK